MEDSAAELLVAVEAWVARVLVAVSSHAAEVDLLAALEEVPLRRHERDVHRSRLFSFPHPSFPRFAVTDTIS